MFTAHKQDDPDDDFEGGRIDERANTETRHKLKFRSTYFDEQTSWWVWINTKPFLGALALRSKGFSYLFHYLSQVPFEKDLFVGQQQLKICSSSSRENNKFFEANLNFKSTANMKF